MRDQEPEVIFSLPSRKRGAGAVKILFGIGPAESRQSLVSFSPRRFWAGGVVSDNALPVAVASFNASRIFGERSRQGLAAFSGPDT